MNFKIFDSQQSKDILELKYYSNSHNGYFKLVVADDVGESIKLINSLTEYAKMNDLKWIIVYIPTKFSVPVNTVWYKNKKTGSIHIHIEDFSRFYINNMGLLVRPNNVYVGVKTEDGGWTRVVDVKKEKKMKVKKIKNDIKKMLVDWTTV